MTIEQLVELMKVLVPGAAAYVGVKVGIAVAMERADQALRMAKRAHERIDNLMERRP